MTKELADRLEWIDEARAIAAQCWCDPETEQKIMDPVLAEAVAKRIALWMETGARHAKNEEYWRERATKAEAIAALRSEPVAWAVTNRGHYVAGNIFRYKADAQMCMDNLNHLHPHEARTMVPLYAAPSRETAKVVPVHSKSQYRRVAAQGGNPVLSRETAKPEAEPDVIGSDMAPMPDVREYLDALRRRIECVAVEAGLDPNEWLTEAQSSDHPTAEPALSAEQNYKSVWKPDELERIIDQYVKHYELNDGETCYDPSDEERIIIKDAIMGLLVDREWDAEWGKHIASLAAISFRTARDEGIETAAKAGSGSTPTTRNLRRLAEWKGLRDEDKQVCLRAADELDAYLSRGQG